MIRFLTQSQIWIGLQAAALSSLTFRFFLIEDVPIPELSIALGGITLLAYQVPLWQAILKRKRLGIMVQQAWLQQSSLRNVLLVALTVLGLLLLIAPQIIKWIQPALLVPLVLGVAYFFNILPFSIYKNLRKLPGVKLPLISLVWTLMTTYPLWSETKLNGVNAAFFAERFLFILAITIPFDIRDVKHDAFKKLLTLPLWVGVKNSKRIALLVLLLAASCMLVFTYGRHNREPLMLAYTLSYLYAGYLIWKSDSDKPRSYYTFWLDGSMGLQALLVGLAINFG